MGGEGCCRTRKIKLEKSEDVGLLDEALSGLQKWPCGAVALPWGVFMPPGCWVELEGTFGVVTANA